MVWAQRAGLKVGLLSARTSPTTPHRAAQLGITLVHQGVPSKVDAYERILDAERLTDDEGRLHGRRHRRPGGAGRASGLSRAPADAVRRGASARRLGQPRATAATGAARELVELILRAQGALGRGRRVLRTRARPDAARAIA